MASLIGQTVSHYKILEPLGAGGMGEVYKALDLKLDRFVALKFLPPGLTRDPDAKQRFIHEAKAASALDHANICTVYEVSETNDGQMFIAMACYQGENLKKKIEQGPLPLNQAVDIVLQAARGLAKAHESGIVHRDIKPANIIVTNDGTAKILDFGLAKVSGRTLLTKSGTTLGTAAYMSPEQALGETTDQRTDIWSLGVTLYEMLTGKRPFESDYEQALVYSIINQDPRPVRDLRPEVPEALGKITRRAMGKRPEERYQTAGEFVADLESYKAGSQLSQQTRKLPAKRRRRMLAIVAAFVVIAGVLALLYSPGRGKPIDSIAVLPLSDYTGDPGKAHLVQGTYESISENLSKVSGLDVRGRTSTERLKGKDMSISEIASRLNVKALVEGSVFSVGDSLRVTLKIIDGKSERSLWVDSYNGRIEEILNLQRTAALGIARAVGAIVKPEVLGSLEKRSRIRPEAYEAYVKGRTIGMSFDLKKMREGVRYLKRAIELDPSFAQAYATLGNVLFTLSHVGEGPMDTIVSRAMDAISHALELDERNGEAWSVLAHIRYDYTYDWRAADSLSKRSLELDPSNADIHQLRGVILSSLSRFEEAEHEMNRCAELDPDNEPYVASLGIPLVASRRYDEAISYLEPLLLRFPGSEIDLTGCFLWHAYVGKRYFDKATALAEKSNHADFLGYSYAVTGRVEEAKKCIDRLLELPTDDPERLVRIALVRVGLGEDEESLELLEKAYKEHSPALAWVRIRPCTYQRLLSHPRYHELEKKFNVPD